MIINSKAERAALIIKNSKVEKLNAFYTYHKEIIDDLYALQKEVSEADSDLITCTLNTIHAKFPIKRH